MQIYIVVTDINDVTYSHESVNTCGHNTFVLHDVIHWKTATSYILYLLSNNIKHVLIKNLAETKVYSISWYQ